MAVNKFEPTDEEREVFNLVKETQPQPKDVSRIRSLVGATPRGALNMLTEQMHTTRGLLEKLPFVGEQFEQANINLEEMEPTQEEKVKKIEDLFPIQEDRFAEQALERTGKILPVAMMGGAGPLSSLMRSGAAGGLGETVKKLGGGPILQGIAETVPFLLPQMGKKIPVSQSESKMAEFARSQGMTEEELALALKKGGLKDQLALKLASKGEKTRRLTDATYNRLSNIWNNLKSSYGGTTPLDPVKSSRLINDMSQKMSKMPSAVTQKIQKDFNDFIGTQMNGENIIDFWQKLNYYIDKGDRVLGMIKPDLENAAKEISNSFGEDFMLANQLYKNFKTTTSALRPSLADKLVDFGEAGLVVKGIVSRDLGLLKTALGAVGGRKLAQELVTNPRLQQLVNRLSAGINSNRPAIVNQLFSKLQYEIGKTDAQAAKKLSEFNVEDFFKD